VKNQGIKPFSPSSTSSFWGEKGERKRRKQGRKGKRKDLVRNEQGLMFLLYFFFFSERRKGKRFLSLTETLGCPLNIWIIPTLTSLLFLLFIPFIFSGFDVVICTYIHPFYTFNK